MSLLLFTLCVLFSTPSFAANKPPSIPEACSNSKTCIQVLESIPKVRAATDYWELCIGMTEYAVSNLTTVLTHIHDLLKNEKEPNKVKALNDCEYGYHYTVEDYGIAAKILIRRDPHDWTPSYEFFITSDGIRRCQAAMATGKIEDQLILKGNEMSEVFQTCGRHVVDDILKIHP